VSTKPGTVHRAVAAGCEVTVFNRGRSPAVYPPGVRVVRGDRTDPADLARLAGLAAGGSWDAVVDVAGSVPAQVRDAARALSPVVGRYVLVSTVSVYRDWPGEPVAETSALHEGDPDAVGPPDGVPGPVAYGVLKAGCEGAVAREYPPDRVLVLRPTVVLGPGEYVGRLPWWLARMRRGGRVLAPGDPGRGVQPVDVGDLAQFVVALVAARGHGVFNVGPPPGRETYGGLLAACAAAAGTDPEITWVDESWLVASGVRQWTELPLWRVPRGTWALDVGAAGAAGLICRPLARTVREVQDWSDAGGVLVPHPRRAGHGIDPEKEAALLRAWDDRP
jgi:2'-hydroxyisoflavone reductase